MTYFYLEAIFLSAIHLGKPSSTDEERKVNPYSKIEQTEKRREILDPEDANDFIFEDEGHTKKDWKKTPTWDVKYKQQVTAEDVFLQVMAAFLYICTEEEPVHPIDRLICFYIKKHRFVINSCTVSH